MRMRQLGRSGIRVSPYCLGTMMFGPNGNRDEAECVAMTHRALDAGINFVDTADVYGYSESETILGKALKGRRDDVVLATKFNGPMGDDPNSVGSSRRWIMKAVEGSLRRLRTDHIDLYQLHHPDPGTDMEEPLSALTDLVRAGKVRAVGTSNLPAADIIEAQWLAERRGLHRPRTEQPTYSLLSRGIEREVLPACRRYGMGVLTWGPLSMGLLTGRYRKGEAPPDNARMRWVPRHLTDEGKLDAVERLLCVAQQAGLPLHHMAMAFATTHPDVTSAIIGPRTLEQLDDLLAAAAVRLDDDVLDAIDGVVPPGTDLGPLDVSYAPPPLTRPGLRRRPADERAAA